MAMLRSMVEENSKQVGLHPLVEKPLRCTSRDGTVGAALPQP